MRVIFLALLCWVPQIAVADVLFDIAKEQAVLEMNNIVTQIENGEFLVRERICRAEKINGGGRLPGVSIPISTFCSLRIENRASGWWLTAWQRTKIGEHPKPSFNLYLSTKYSYAPRQTVFFAVSDQERCKVMKGCEKYSEVQDSIQVFVENEIAEVFEEN